MKRRVVTLLALVITGVSGFVLGSQTPSVLAQAKDHLRYHYPPLAAGAPPRPGTGVSDQRAESVARISSCVTMRARSHV